MYIGKYRHEYKYLIYFGQYKFLETQARAIMKPDLHAKEGVYNIRSLYFDDYNNNCFYENENGTDPREKYRIRIYNHNLNRISLECKRKENGKTLKTSCLITIDQCKKLMKGEPVDDYLKQDPLIIKVCLKILNDKLHPVTIIEYNRKPYICENGNVRVTFDCDISSSNYIDMFLENDVPMRSVLPVGLNLLEVKYDDFLPDNIYNCLQLGSLNMTNFSKYYLGRIYELGRNTSIKGE